MKTPQVFTTKLLRGLRQLWYWDVWHLQPSAPLNWRYLLPNQSATIQLHRHLWWYSRYKLPGLLWLPLEIGRWLHWQLWASPRILTKAVESYGADVETRFGIPIQQQRYQLGYWAKTWCINPYQGYNWQLYRADVDGLAIIYESETSAYHALQNSFTGGTKADHRLLGDKIALAELLSAFGIPMVDTEYVSGGDWQDIETALIRQPKLFCKLRSGNQGESAFAVWRDENGLQGLAHNGADLPDELAVRSAWQVLTGKGEVLIQPLLVNHSDFAHVLVSSEAVVLRIVTSVKPDGIFIWWAELQVPSEASPAGGRGFWRFPVSVADGAVSAMNREWFLKQDWQDEYDALWQTLSGVAQVPHFALLCNHSLSAHHQLPKVWTIAWDWVITPDGPVLLEGNSGWGLCELQQQGDDLVSLALNGS